MYRKCCIENCASKRKDVKMHQFPTSETGLQKWLQCIDSASLSNLSVQQLRKLYVCHKHFEARFFTKSSRLCIGAFPTLFSAHEQSTGLPMLQSELNVNVTIEHSYSKKRKHEDHSYSKTADVTDETAKRRRVSQGINLTLLTDTFTESSHTHPIPSTSGISTHVENSALSPVIVLQKSLSSRKPIVKAPQRKRIIHKVSALSPRCKKIYAEFIKSKRQLNFSERAKRALKFSKSDFFTKMTSNMNPLARKIFWMQVKQSTSKVTGRRYSLDDKMIALSIMKQGPKSYRFLQRIFVLPSRQTLNRLISGLKISPGINKQIFEAMKNEITTWPEKKKYCSIIFDEVSLQPGLTYNKSRDAVDGFVELTTKSNQFADHALTFILRGAVHRWQQPVAFYFCEGATKREQLKIILKDLVAAVVETGLLPIALICDQGTSFQSTLNSLVEDTRRDENNSERLNDDCIIRLSGQELAVIYDPPHLIKGIRNNFLTKNIVSEGKVSKWSDIVDVYLTDCKHAQARLLHKLNDHHVLPKNINKMKVKNCTRVLSKTVAAALSYTSQFAHYSDGREISPTLANTAETVSFFDDLFDSCNGSAISHKHTTGKHLRRAVTENSEHHAFWRKAMKKIEKMRFVPQDRTKVARYTVPSLKNWIITIKSLQRLWLFFKSKCVKIMRPRYFNSDPIENFFGQIRAYNFRNTDPDCHTFVSTFRSLLITRFINFHSETYNCESDKGEQVINISSLFEESETQKSTEITVNNVTVSPVENESIVIQAIRERLSVHSRAYTAGWLVRKILQKVKCEACKACLTTEKGAIHNWISHKEYSSINQHKLTYPSEYAVRHFGDIVKESNEYLEEDAHKSNVMKNICEQIRNKYSIGISILSTAVYTKSL